MKMLKASVSESSSTHVPRLNLITELQLVLASLVYKASIDLLLYRRLATHLIYSNWVSVTVKFSGNLSNISENELEERTSRNCLHDVLNGWIGCLGLLYFYTQLLITSNSCFISTSNRILTWDFRWFSSRVAYFKTNYNHILPHPL
jgi:hypothetical protein